MPYHSPEKNIEIYYEISGNNNGPKMILIHGLFLNSDCWRFQLSGFESNFHILRFDLRGHGRSTKLEDFAKGISIRGLSPYNNDTAEFVAKIVTDHMTKKDCLQATAASAGFNICENLETLNIPVLVLVGKKDITTPVWASEMIHEWLPQSELVIIPDAGHLTIFDHSKEFNDLVLNFWGNQ